MKITVALLSASLVTACATDTGGVVAVDQPRDGELAALSSLPVDQVASCMSDRLRVGAVADGDGYVLSVRQPAPTGTVTFRIRPIADRLERFVTQVDRIGYASHDLPEFATCYAPVTTTRSLRRAF